MHLHIHLNAEHGETEGDESPEAEENVSFFAVVWHSLNWQFDLSHNLLIVVSLQIKPVI